MYRRKEVGEIKMKSKQEILLLFSRISDVVESWNFAESEDVSKYLPAFQYLQGSYDIFAWVLEHQSDRGYQSLLDLNWLRKSGKLLKKI